MYLNILNNNVDLSPNLALSKSSSDNQSLQGLNDHKSLIERYESIGRMGYWEFNLKSNKIWASSGARQIYGLDERDLSLDDIQVITFPEYRPKLDLMFENLIVYGEKYDVEFKIHRQNDGKIIDIRSQANYDKNEKTVYGIIHDISEQNKVKEEINKSKEKDDDFDFLKSLYMSNLSHEIRTPMNGIVGCAHLLTETDIENSTRKEYSEIIHSCCDQLLDIINNMLDMAKIESGQMIVDNGWVNINDLLNDIHEICNREALKKNLELRINNINSIQECSLFTDQSKLNRVILNLIDNAIRFTTSGYIEIGYTDHSGCMEFYVKDTGIGITPLQQEIIFKPFCHSESLITQEQGRTGLGLAISGKYISLLGGKIWLKSQPGVGTTFYFTLPKIQEKNKSAEKLSTRKNQNHQKTCLIVDDMEMNYLYLQALITPMGFSVLWARDGNQAIEMALGNNNIDLILMDIRLPLIDGCEATKVIKEKASRFANYCTIGKCSDR